jgi:transcriptional regulator with XRE-family HTH domain
MTTLSAIVATLTAAREAAGLGQRDLARRLGIAHATLAQWETGQRTPAADALLAWAHVLGVDLVPLTGRERDAYARGHADGWAACANAVADAVADALVPALTARPDHATGA